MNNVTILKIVGSDNLIVCDSVKTARRELGRIAAVSEGDAKEYDITETKNDDGVIIKFPLREISFKIDTYEIAE